MGCTVGARHRCQQRGGSPASRALAGPSARGPQQGGMDGGSRPTLPGLHDAPYHSRSSDSFAPRGGGGAIEGLRVKMLVL